MLFRVLYMFESKFNIKISLAYIDLNGCFSFYSYNYSF